MALLLHTVRALLRHYASAIRDESYCHCYAIIDITRDITLFIERRHALRSVATMRVIDELRFVDDIITIMLILLEMARMPQLLRHMRCC